MKKNRFAIFVDEPGRAKLYLKALVKLLKEDFNFLKEERSLTRTKAIGKATKGNFIVFGTHKKFDYTTLTKADFIEDYADVLDVYGLSTEFNAIVKRIKKYVRNSNSYYVDRDFTDIIVMFEDDDYYTDEYYCYKPKKSSKKVNKKKRAKTLEEVQVFNNYVQVGWDNFTIQEDPRDGQEFIVVDGNVYWVKRDSRGYGYLDTNF